jgi:hypothetical protein
VWECKKCREQIEDSFEVCWNCGTSRDGREDPSFRRAEEVEAEAETGIAIQLPAPSSASSLPARQTASECPKCGSRQVIPAVRVLDHDGEYGAKDLSVRLDRNPDALIFKGSEVVELRASVCGRCGYVEMYATNPEALWTAYQEQTK